MDKESLRIDELSSDNAEIVGFNGRAIGHCGISLPIVRDTKYNLYAVLTFSRSPSLAWDQVSTFNAKVESQRAVRFPSDQVLPLNPQYAQNSPVVFWMDTVLATLLNIPLTNRVSLVNGQIASCLSKSDAEKLFEQLRVLSQQCFDASLQSPNPDWGTINRWADIGMQSARTLDTKYWMYVRKALVLYYRPKSPPELAFQLFRTAIQPAYQSATWDAFSEAMNVILKACRSATRTAIQALSPESGVVHLESQPDAPATSSTPGSLIDRERMLMQLLALSSPSPMQAVEGYAHSLGLLGETYEHSLAGINPMEYRYPEVVKWGFPVPLHYSNPFNLKLKLGYTPQEIAEAVKRFASTKAPKTKRKK